MTSPETRIKLKLKRQIKALKEHHALYFTSISDRYRSGMPDNLIICEGWHVFIECKAEGKSLRPLQRKVADDIRYGGGCVRVYRGEELTSMEDIHNLPLE